MELRAAHGIQSYLKDRIATQPSDASRPGTDFAGMARSFADVLQQGESEAMGAMTGKSDPHSLVQALAQTELAVETAVSIRNRVVEAYQEILRMPV